MPDLKPGRELDALIAERVMGWRNNKADPTKPGMWGINDWREDGSPVLMPDFPPYSSDIESAWEVVEHLQRWKFTLAWQYDFGGGGIEPFPYATAIFDPVFNELRPGLLAKALTAPHAICLAALKAVGAD